MIKLPTEVVILGSSPKLNMAWYLPLETIQAMGKEIIADPKEEIYPEQKYSAVVVPLRNRMSLQHSHIEIYHGNVMRCTTKILYPTLCLVISKYCIVVYFL